MISSSILIYNTKLGMSGDKVLYHCYIKGGHCPVYEAGKDQVPL